LVFEVFCIDGFSWNKRLREALVTDRFCFEHFFYSSAIFILAAALKPCQQDFYAFLNEPVYN